MDLFEQGSGSGDVRGRHRGAVEKPVAEMAVVIGGQRIALGENTASRGREIGFQGFAGPGSPAAEITDEIGLCRIQVSQQGHFDTGGPWVAAAPVAEPQAVVVTDKNHRDVELVSGGLEVDIDQFVTALLMVVEDDHRRSGLLGVEGLDGEIAPPAFDQNGAVGEGLARFRPAAGLIAQSGGVEQGKIQGVGKEMVPEMVFDVFCLNLAQPRIETCGCGEREAEVGVVGGAAVGGAGGHGQVVGRGVDQGRWVGTLVAGRGDDQDSGPGGVDQGAVEGVVITAAGVDAPGPGVVDNVGAVGDRVFDGRNDFRRVGNGVRVFAAGVADPVAHQPGGRGDAAELQLKAVVVGGYRIAGGNPADMQPVDAAPGPGPGVLFTGQRRVVVPEIGPGDDDLAVVVAAVAKARGRDLRRKAEAFAAEHRREVVQSLIEDGDLDAAAGVGR